MQQYAGLAKVSRILYKHLLRSAREFDRHRVLRFYWITQQSRLYIPSQTIQDNNHTMAHPWSYQEEVKKQFKMNRQAVGSEQEERISEAFNFSRQFAETFKNATTKIPWWLDLPKPKFNENGESPVVKLSNSTIQPGMILISHPLAEVSKIGGPDIKQSVWLVIQVTKEGIVHSVLLSDPKQGTRFDKKFILSTKRHLFLTAPSLIMDGIFFGEPNANISEADPTEYRLLPKTLSASSEQLKHEIEHGLWFLASCPANVLFKEKQPEFIELPQEEKSVQHQQQETREEIKEEMSTPRDYDFSLDKPDELWKRMLNLMGGEFELCVWCLEKPPGPIVDQE